MRVHFIANQGTDIAFFPDSIRYFKVNAFTKELIASIAAAEPVEVILQKFNLSLPEYDQFLAQLQEVILPVENVDTNSYHVKSLDRLVFNISNTCNMDCVYCYANGGHYLSEAGLMTEAVAVQGLKTCLEYFDGIKLIQLFGGEPFLNIPVMEAIAQNLEKLYPLSGLYSKPALGVVTNGTILNDQIIELINKYHILVTVSLDGPKVVNDQMKRFKDGSGTFDTIAANITRLRETTGEPKTIEVAFHKGHLAENISVTDVVRFFNEMFPGVEAHIVPVDCGPDCPAVLPDYSAFIDSVDDVFAADDLNQSLRYLVIEGLVNNLHDRKSCAMLCTAAVNTLAIAATGEIYPCFALTDRQEYYMGHILGENPFQHPDFLKVKALFGGFSKLKDEPCQSCFINRICKGCFGRNDTLSGHIFSFPQAYCEMTRKMAERVIVNFANRE